MEGIGLKEHDDEVCYAAETLLRMRSFSVDPDEIIDLEDEYFMDEEEDENEEQRGGEEEEDGDVYNPKNKIEDEDEEDNHSPLLRSKTEKRNLLELLSKIPYSHFTGEEEEKTGENGHVNSPMVAATSSSSSKTVGLRGGRMAFPALYFMCALRNAMVTLLDSAVCQGSECAEDEQVQVASFTQPEIMETLITLNHGDERILGARNKPPQIPLELTTRGALTVLSVKPSGRPRGQWRAVTSYNSTTGRWSWLGPRPEEISDPRLHHNRPIIVEIGHRAWGLSKSAANHLVQLFYKWVETEGRYSAAIATLRARAAVPVTTVHDLMGYMVRLRGEYVMMFNVPISFPAMRALFQLEERFRYSVPERAFKYTAVDGVESAVSPVYTSKETTPRRRSLQLQNDSPAGICILSVVRDAASRLPQGKGSTKDVCTLVHDSQYLTGELTENPAKLQVTVGNSLHRLSREMDPPVVYVRVAGTRGFWRYLHRARGLDEFPEEGRKLLKKRMKRRRNEN